MAFRARNVFGTFEKQAPDNKLNPQMTPDLEIEPGPHWWEASALTNAPSLHTQYAGVHNDIKGVDTSVKVRSCRLLRLASLCKDVFFATSSVCC